MAAYDVLPQTLDGQSLTATPFSKCYFNRRNGPTSNSRPMRAVGAEAIGVGTKDVRSQPQAVTWDLHSILSDATEANRLLFYKIMSEDRDLVFLVVNDGDGAAWRTEVRVTGNREVTRLHIITSLWVPDPVWQENAETTETDANMSGASSQFSPQPINVGSRDERPIYVITPNTVKSAKVNVFRDGYRGAVTNPLDGLYRGPLALTDESGADSPIDHAAVVAAGNSLANGDDIRVYFDGAEIDRYLGGANTTVLRIWHPDAVLPKAAPHKLLAAITAGSPADGGDLAFADPIDDLAETGTGTLGNETISWRSRDLVNRELKTIARGAWGSTAASHGITDTLADTFRRCHLFLVTNNKSASINPPDDLEHRPAIQLPGSKNYEWRIGDKADDPETVFYDAKRPNRSAMFTPALVQPTNDDAPGLRLESTVERIGFQDSDPTPDKPERNRLTLTIPQGIIPVANAVTYDITKQRDTKLLVLGRGASGGPLQELADEQAVIPTFVAAQGREPANLLTELVFQGARSPVLGSDADDGGNVEIASGDAIAQRFVLTRETVITDLILRLKVISGTNVNFLIEILDNASPSDPTNAGIQVATIVATSTEPGSPVEFEEVLFAAPKPIILPAGTYWLHVAAITGGGSRKIQLATGLPHTPVDTLFLNTTVQVANAIWMRLIHDTDGPVQAEVLQLAQAIEVSADKLILTLGPAVDKYTGQVAAGNDDASERDNGTGFSASSPTLDMDSNINATNRWNSGVRFRNLNIPKDAVIKAAKLRLFFADTGEDDLHVNIRGDDVDDAVDFASDADVTTRVTNATTASVAWEQEDVAIGWLDSPDIAAVLQEIVDRAGWVAGNAAVILLEGLTTPDKTAAAKTYDSAPGQAATLEVVYEDEVARTVPYVHRVSSWANDLYHCTGQISNDTTGQTLDFDVWMVTGSTFTVDCEAQTGEYKEGNHIWQLPGAVTPSDDEEWIKLQPGTNTHTYTEADMVDTTLDLKFRGDKV